MAPEVICGEPLRAASDIYSLGILAYQLVTGRPPFQAATVSDTLRQVQEGQPVLPRLLNAAIRGVPCPRLSGFTSTR